MGKNKSEAASVKISKDDKKQLSSCLIKVMRPKVYITDASSFKRLVQELTGNGNIIPISSAPPPTTAIQPQRPVEQHVPLILEIEDDDDDQLFYQEESISHVEMSADSPEQSMPTSFTALETSPEPPSILETFGTSTTTTSSESPLANHHRDQIDFSSQLRVIESWLLEMDQFPNYYDGYAPISAEQEVCVHDYDLSGLI